MSTSIKRITLMLGLSFFVFFGFTQKINYTNNWGKQGLTVLEQKADQLQLIYSVHQFVLKTQKVNGTEMKMVHMPGVFLPNDEGKPNLPGNGHMIAIPQGTTPKLELIDCVIETYHNILIGPSPNIPLDSDKKPLVYNMDQKTYSKDKFYPESPFQLSKQSKLRGVDFVTLGITPFQYNPVTKTLKVYRDIKFDVTFKGGNGQFGDPKYRCKAWESILQNSFINFASLPQLTEIKKNKSSNDEADYVIITIDNEDFIQKANEIAEFRRKQGISTTVKTLSEINGNVPFTIKSWILHSYTYWNNPMEAVLLLGDYSTEEDGIASNLYEYNLINYNNLFPSDNYYSDMNGDDLPDIIVARIPAENTNQLNTMVSKFIDYETNPPTDSEFYQNPVTALGWQTERWFQICSEAIGGFWRKELNKTPVRVNSIYEGDPNSTVWSTASNTDIVMDYFGPGGVGYLPRLPSDLGGWNDGTTEDIIAAINNGTFVIQHRDHGAYTGWGEPYFKTPNINSLTNTNNRLPFVFSINCQTGAFHNPTNQESFAEAFYRYTYNGENSGALGLIAATESSFSFVNDVYAWGVYDNLWPEFLPDYGTTFTSKFIYPAFGNAAGKIFLHQSSWPSWSELKVITYRLFHHLGDAYLNLYTEVPQTLSVETEDTHFYNNFSLNITADIDANIAVTYYDKNIKQSKIIGKAFGTGSPMNMNLLELPVPGNNILITVTKQNYLRYEKQVMITVPSGPYDVVTDIAINDDDNRQADYGETFNIDFTISNTGLEKSEDIVVTMTSSDTLIESLTNAQQIAIGSLNKDESYTTEGNFLISLHNSIPDGTVIAFTIQITDATGSIYVSNHVFEVHAPIILINKIQFIDKGNQDSIFEPTESVDVSAIIINKGHSKASNLSGSITALNDLLLVNLNSTTPRVLEAGDTTELLFNTTISGNVTNGDVTTVKIRASAGTNEYYNDESTKPCFLGIIHEYCEAGSNDITDEYIERVQLGNIDNSSNHSSYTDYTSLSTNVVPDSSYTLIVTNGLDWDIDQIGCWIDWNFDGDFQDENETIATTYENSIGTASIDVPTNAYVGKTRMRIRVIYGNDLQACGFSDYGEVEDYTLNITPKIYAGFAYSYPAVACSNAETNLILANWVGENIQWYKSSDGINWLVINNSGNDTLALSSINDFNFYKARISTTNFEDEYSNIIEIQSIDPPYAKYSYEKDSLTVTFTNESEGADSYFWDFGDNSNYSQEQNPVYTYTEEGIYTITLRATKNYCEDAVYEKVISVPYGLDNAGNELEVNIYPNPNNGLFNVTALNGTTVTVYSYTGEKLFEGHISNSKTIDISGYPVGLYILKFEYQNKTAHKKIIKN